MLGRERSPRQRRQRRQSTTRRTESTTSSLRLSVTTFRSGCRTLAPHNSFLLPKGGRGVASKPERPLSLHCGNSPYWSDSPFTRKGGRMSGGGGASRTRHNQIRPADSKELRSDRSRI